MKIRFLLPSLTLALACTLGLSPLQAADGGKDPETELGKVMEKMGGTFRRLGRQIKDASKNQDSLQAVATLRDAAKASLKHEPMLKAKQPASEQAAYVERYKKKMNEMIALLDQLEAALKANDNEKAAALCAKVNDTQKEGHKDFKPAGKKKA